MKFLSFLLPILLCVSCISDSFEHDSNARLEFSTDSILIGPVLSGQLSPTSQFVLYNRSKNGVTVDRINLTDDPENIFRLRVDGQTGDSYENIEIRGEDSLFLFIDVELPSIGGNRRCNIQLTNGTSTTLLPVKASVVDVVEFPATSISADETWNGNFHITGNVTVEAGATLELAPATRLFFAPGVSLEVFGTLRTEGEPGQIVEFTGDRLDRLAPEIPYELISGQWAGIILHPGSQLELSYASLRNPSTAISADNAVVNLYNCQIRNSSGNLIYLTNSSLDAVGCEFAEAAGNVLCLENSNADIRQSTVANFYLLSFPVDPILVIENSSLDVSNSIIYGLAPILPGNQFETFSPVYFRRCLFQLDGNDDDNFLDCVWGTDPMLGTIREEYLFDYRPLPLSPAVSNSDPKLMPANWSLDFYGTPTTSMTLGAYSMEYR